MSLKRLNVGAGRRPEPGWINADLAPGPGLDVVFDACKPWPFKDGTFGHVFGNQMLEHLPDPLSFFKEAWRCLVPNGFLELTTPYGHSNEAIADPTHLKSWIPASFCFLQPGFDEESQNPQHLAWKWPFAIESVMRSVNPELRVLMYKPWRRWGIRLLPYLYNAYDSLHVVLRVLKGDVAVAMYRADHFPQQVVVRDYMYRHRYEGRELRKGETKTLVFFAERGEY